MRKVILLFCFCSFFIAVKDSYSFPEQKWAQKYNFLKSKIEKNFEQPPMKSPVEVYLTWMGTKAQDRDEVKSLLEEIKAILATEPENQEIKEWEQRFTRLLYLAQASGESTVNGAAMMYMYVRDNHCPKCANWKEVISRLKDYGRSIYTKSKETDFLTPQVVERAKCMLNFSIRDVEGGNLGVYKGREGSFGETDSEGNIVIPERDFDVDCEPRDSFSYTAKGEPTRPTEMGLKMINEVKEEASWWNFPQIEEDAKSLMEEYFQDTMCKTPPNRCDKGHKQYKEMAQEYNLSKALEYNQGFYARLYGKVEIKSNKGRKPAKEAKVSLKSLLSGESWTTQTDKEGKYEFKSVLLHKECKPLVITASYGNDEVEESFYGPLEEPDPNFSLEKNLVIKKGQGRFYITIENEWSIPYISNEGGGAAVEGKGRSKMILQGSFVYVPEKSNSLQDFYKINKVKVQYFYDEKVHDYLHENCPEVVENYEYEDSYSYEPSEPTLFFLQKSVPGAPIGDMLIFNLPHYSDIKVKGSRYICPNSVNDPVVQDKTEKEVEFLGVSLQVLANTMQGQSSKKNCSNAFTVEISSALTSFLGEEMEEENCSYNRQRVYWKFNGLKN